MSGLPPVQKSSCGVPEQLTPGPSSHLLLTRLEFMLLTTAAPPASSCFCIASASALLTPALTTTGAFSTCRRRTQIEHRVLLHQVQLPAQRPLCVVTLDCNLRLNMMRLQEGRL
jgi:hypothetical protein